MAEKLRALVFEPIQGEPGIIGLLENLSALSAYEKEFAVLESLEELERQIVDWKPSVLFVVADGALGMECVYRAKERKPTLPVFWFSDDRDFGVQSYRLGCAYFSLKPVTGEKLRSAFSRCRHLGIQYKFNL